MQNTVLKHRSTLRTVQEVVGGAVKLEMAAPQQGRARRDDGKIEEVQHGRADRNKLPPLGQRTHHNKFQQQQSCTDRDDHDQMINGRRIWEKTRKED